MYLGTPKVKTVNGERAIQTYETERIFKVGVADFQWEDDAK
jgi:hypothetical protein